jgi:hypothetical protein
MIAKPWFDPSGLLLALLIIALSCLLITLLNIQ